MKDYLKSLRAKIVLALLKVSNSDIALLIRKLEREVNNISKRVKALETSIPIEVSISSTNEVSISISSLLMIIMNLC